jgi:hypothetical protein
MTAAALGTKPTSNTSVCLCGETNELIAGQECSRCVLVPVLEAVHSVRVSSAIPSDVVYCEDSTTSECLG